MAEENNVSKHDKKQQKKQQKMEERNKQSQTALSANRKKDLMIYAGIAILIVAVGYGLLALANRTPNTTPIGGNPDDILNVNLRDHSSVAMHIHQDLEILINGKKETVPPNIGISAAGMRPIHTHDATGKLHVEPPYPHQFRLKDFFTVWGKHFNSTCIFEHCVDDQHTLKFFVNGQLNTEYENLLLEDGQKILIEYAEK